MNIGVCVPLNQGRPQHTASQGPIRYVTDEAAERAEIALSIKAQLAAANTHETSR